MFATEHRMELQNEVFATYSLLGTFSGFSGPEVTP